MKGRSFGRERETIILEVSCTHLSTGGAGCWLLHTIVTVLCFEVWKD